MLQLDNETPFEAAMAVMPDEAGVDTLYPTVKATFELSPRPVVAGRQEPIVPADEYRGDPAASSLRRAGELHPAKPATDVVLLGSAHSPGGRPVERLDVRLTVGPLAKTVRVHGDRRWIGGVTGLTPSRPRPFDRLPLTWERAFGGALPTAGGGLAGEPRNPCGVGHPAGRPRRRLIGTPLPNLDDSARPLRTAGEAPAPAGFGFVAPAWQPRLGYAGTYDETWQRERAPYLPADFDRRFFNTAAPGLSAPGFLRGGEPVRLENASPRGPLAFRLPRCEIEVAIRLGSTVERPPVHLETVLLEPDADRLTLLWRAAFGCDKKLLAIDRVGIRLLALDLAGGRSAA